jgi:serine/threonine protein phosphatase PrpC
MEQLACKVGETRWKIPTLCP